MPRYQAYQCDECGGKFRWLHHPSDSPPPEQCPLCGAAGSAAASFIPQAPAIKGVAAAAGDQVYRSMEAGSEYRMQVAAEQFGGDASDYNALKITDLKDNQREGDTAYKMPAPAANVVGQFMQQNPAAPVGSQHAAQAMAYAEAAHQGYFPHAGSRTSSVVGNVHSRLAAQMAAKGQMNK